MTLYQCVLFLLASVTVLKLSLLHYIMGYNTKLIGSLLIVTVKYMCKVCQYFVNSLPNVSYCVMLKWKNTENKKFC